MSLNWLLQKSSGVIPILGARSVKHLEDNLGCLDFVLSPEQMQRLENVSQIDLGFPHNFIASDMVQQTLNGGASIQLGASMMPKKGLGVRGDGRGQGELS